MYLLPLATLVSNYELRDETYLSGDLQESVKELLEDYIPNTKLRVIRNKALSASINFVYPEHTNLWTILDGILHRYHLIVSIKASSIDQEPITIKFMEGPAWKS